MWPFARGKSSSPRARFRAGTRLLRQGRLEEAIAALKQLCDEQPDDAGALLNLGIAHHRDGKHTKAIETFERLIELEPDEPRAYLNMAAAENALGHMDKAQELLLRALELDPQQSGVHYNLAVIYLKRNQLANAMAEMELELAVNPRHAETEAALRALRKRVIPQ